MYCSVCVCVGGGDVREFVCVCVWLKPSKCLTVLRKQIKQV